MNADEARERAASALSQRLRAWKVDSPEVRGREFIGELMNAGWLWMPTENRPRPPRREQECEVHAGQWDGRCAGCAADRLGIPDDAPIQPRRLSHGTPKPPIRDLIEGATP